jgi:hypothetical protein
MSEPQEGSGERKISELLSALGPREMPPPIDPNLADLLLSQIYHPGVAPRPLPCPIEDNAPDSVAYWQRELQLELDRSEKSEITGPPVVRTEGKSTALAMHMVYMIQRAEEQRNANADNK